MLLYVKSVQRGTVLVYEGPWEGSNSQTVTPGMCVSAGGQGLVGLVAEFSGSTKQRVVPVSKVLLICLNIQYSRYISIATILKMFFSCIRLLTRI